LHIIPLDNLQIDPLNVFEPKPQTPATEAPAAASSINDQEKENGLSGFVLFNPDVKGVIKSAVAVEGKEAHFRELYFFCENRKQKMEWMLSFKLNLVSSPTYH